MGLNDNSQEKLETNKNEVHDDQHFIAPAKNHIYLESKMISQNCLQQIIPNHRQVIQQIKDIL